MHFPQAEKLSHVQLRTGPIPFPRLAWETFNFQLNNHPTQECLFVPVKPDMHSMHDVRFRIPQTECPTLHASVSHLQTGQLGRGCPWHCPYARKLLQIHNSTVVPKNAKCLAQGSTEKKEKNFISFIGLAAWPYNERGLRQVSACHEAFQKQEYIRSTFLKPPWHAVACLISTGNQFIQTWQTN